MIEKLRKRFFRISLIAMTTAMILVTVAINMMNWLNVRSELWGTISMLAEENLHRPEREPLGSGFPDDGFPGNGMAPEGSENPARQGAEKDRSRHERNLMTESIFFTAAFSEERGIEVLGLPPSGSLSEEEASVLVTQALESGRQSGFIGDYIFRCYEDSQSGGSSYIFLDTETRLSHARHLGWFSLAACVAGILLAMVAVSRFSRRAVEPILKNEREQKQFITDASHELKTPLTVISANMDVLSMDVPGNTWIRSTQKQVAQMRRLVDELVYLSRLEENDRPLETRRLLLTPLLEDIAEPFAAMAEFQGKSMEIRAEKSLAVMGDENALRRLMSTLCDNAVKYAAEEGEILVEARTEGQKAMLRFSNTVSEPLSPEQCERLFQRFYRVDASRNKEKKSGFGIGLSIAAAIAEKHGGSIRAEMAEGNRLVITCLLPRSAD